MNIKNIEEQTKQKIKYYKEIKSTHLYAKQVEKDGDAILIAEEQTGGIGTKGRIWYTDKNENIAMTIIKHPNCKIENLKELTTLIAQKIQKVIKQLYGYELQIKIPNDLILNGKKICGILTEIHTKGEIIEYLLISIGFNVNQEKFVDEIRGVATSLKNEYSKEFDREEIIINIINEIEKIIEQL